MIIENKTNLTNELMYKLLEQKLPHYKYESINEIVVVTLQEDVQLNILTDSKEIELIEGVPFKIKLTIAISLLVVAYIVLSFTGWFVGFKILLYIFSFLLGGSLSDLLHKYRFRAIYKPAKDEIRKTIKSSMKPKNR